MKTWLHLWILFCCLNTIFAIPAPVQAAPSYQDDMAILQLENQSDQPIALCEIFAVRKPTEVVLDFQEQIELASGEHKQFSVPTGRYRLLVTDYEQNVFGK